MLVIEKASDALLYTPQNKSVNVKLTFVSDLPAHPLANNIGLLSDSGVVPFNRRVFD